MINKLAKLNTKERVLAGLLAVAVIGFIFTLFHVFVVIQEVKNPHAQSVRALKGAQPMSEEELQQAEMQFQPKNVLTKPAQPQGSADKNFAVPSKAVGAAAAKSDTTK